MNNAQFLELAIPDDIRTLSHPDGEMIKSLAALLLTVMRNTSCVWEKNTAKEVHAALNAWNEEVLKPHLSKEDEDWSALKATASEVESLREIAAKVPELEAIVEEAKTFSPLVTPAEAFESAVWMAENHIQELRQRQQRIYENESGYKGLAGYRRREATIKAIQAEIDREEASIERLKSAGVEAWSNPST